MNADVNTAFVGLPGTGKTTALMGVLTDELERGTEPDAIAASTFRKSMAQEFIDTATAADGPIDEMPEDHWFGTTHSLCYRLLGYEDVVQAEHKADVCQQLGIQCSASLSLEDKADLASTVTGGSNVGDLAFQARSWCLNTNHDPREEYRKSPLSVQERTEVQHSPTSFAEFNDAYESYKEEHDLIDFDDMLLIVRDQGLVPDVKVLISDEFQDKSPLQVDIFENWSQEIDRTFIAGDMFQAVYGFAGTRPKYMEEAREEADEDIVLDTSYRFGPELWDFATRILERAQYDVPSIHPSGESSVHKIGFEDYRRIVEQKAETDCLHLFRCNYMTDKATEVLKQVGVPFSSPSGVRWTDRLVDLYNGIVKLTTTARKVQSSDFGGLRAQYDLRHIGASEALQLAKAMRATHQRGTKKGNVESLEAVLDEEAPETTRADVNLFDVFNLGGFFEAVRSNQNPITAGAFTKSAFGSSSARDRLEAAWRQLDGNSIERINHRVQTIHGSKGMEADTVFLFTGISRRIQSDHGPFPFRSPPEARIFFVGATRAETDLYVVEYPNEPTITLPQT